MVRAFYQSGWSKVLIGVTSYLAAWSHMNDRVEYMQSRFPGSISRTGRKWTDDVPGWSPWWTVCIIPAQDGRGFLRCNGMLWSVSVASTSVFEQDLISKFSDIKPCGFSVFEFRCLIFILPTVSISCKLTVFLGTETVTFLPGVTVAIIPIPWNVFKPSIVLILWSILSATYSIWTSGLTFGISVPLTTDALRSNRWISQYKLQNPCSWSESMRNLELKWWCNWTPRPNCSGATNTRTLQLA